MWSPRDRWDSDGAASGSQVGAAALTKEVWAATSAFVRSRSRSRSRSRGGRTSPPAPGPPGRPPPPSAPWADDSASVGSSYFLRSFDSYTSAEVPCFVLFCLVLCCFVPRALSNPPT